MPYDPDLHQIANLFESLLWMLFAAASAIHARKAPAQEKRRFWNLTAAFVAFAISDLIEVQTGAWWRPIWLLAWKTCCLSAILFNTVQLMKLRRLRLNPPTAR